MGRSMELAQRTTPGMTVVPNRGYRAMQWFNAQGSGFGNGATGVNVCWTPPNGTPTCQPQPILFAGAAGLGIQLGGNAPYGTWTVSMCEIGGGERCTTGTFTVLIDPD